MKPEEHQAESFLMRVLTIAVQNAMQRLLAPNHDLAVAVVVFPRTAPTEANVAGDAPMADIAKALRSTAVFIESSEVSKALPVERSIH